MKFFMVLGNHCLTMRDGKNVILASKMEHSQDVEHTMLQISNSEQ